MGNGPGGAENHLVTCHSLASYFVRDSVSVSYKVGLKLTNLSIYSQTIMKVQ